MSNLLWMTSLSNNPIGVLNLTLQEEPNSVSSDPLQVCMCVDGITNCSTQEFTGQV